jgi:hypothetical protein
MPAITLADAIARYGRNAYLLTIGKDGPRTSNVSVDLRGNLIACSLGAFRNQEHRARAEGLAVLVTPRAWRLRDDSQRHCDGNGAGRRRSTCRDLPHQVGPAPSRSETRG